MDINLKVGFWAVLGLVTLAPAGASHANIVGYHSICPFAPISSMILFLIAYRVYVSETEKNKVESTL
jgi:hypothetical protein